MQTYHTRILPSSKRGTLHIGVINDQEECMNIRIEKRIAHGGIPIMTRERVDSRFRGNDTLDCPCGNDTLDWFPGMTGDHLGAGLRRGRFVAAARCSFRKEIYFEKGSEREVAYFINNAFVVTAKSPAVNRTK